MSEPVTGFCPDCGERVIYAAIDENDGRVALDPQNDDAGPYMVAQTLSAHHRHECEKHDEH